ncbi:hypothetical protein EVAR_29615_1 [Eumeta japonica]|uniref:Uncharacterized protein n=1 Tax=Eumeta variegata TaxID=151549 RepID=A0A4C1VT78_EUMVA|nr:hypothetical protein EVAR_29615_1 [Eumeta japonica]
MSTTTFTSPIKYSLKPCNGKLRATHGPCADASGAIKTRICLNAGLAWSPYQKAINIQKMNDSVPRVICKRLTLLAGFKDFPPRFEQQILSMQLAKALSFTIQRMFLSTKRSTRIIQFSIHGGAKCVGEDAIPSPAATTSRPPPGPAPPPGPTPDDVNGPPRHAPPDYK